jgi:hypothetical protein
MSEGVFQKMTRLTLSFLGVGLIFSLVHAQNTLSPVKILIGPNILVSRDGDVPHDEFMIAANPGNPKNLLGGVMSYTGRDGVTDHPQIVVDQTEGKYSGRIYISVWWQVFPACRTSLLGRQQERDFSGLDEQCARTLARRKENVRTGPSRRES